MMSETLGAVVIQGPQGNTKFMDRFR